MTLEVAATRQEEEIRKNMNHIFSNATKGSVRKNVVHGKGNLSKL